MPTHRKDRALTNAPRAAKARAVVGEGVAKPAKNPSSASGKKPRQSPQAQQPRNTKTKTDTPRPHTNTNGRNSAQTTGRRKIDATRRRDFKRGEVYHIYQRGNFKQKVFHSWMQTAKYRNRLLYLALRYKVRIHTFCLMANHIHLVLEPTNKLGIGLLMRDLQSGHALMVNTWMGIRGNLWQQNYRAKHIDSSAYYRTVIHYVETNPVKAGCVAKAEDYWWSGALAHVAKGSVSYEWLYPAGFGSKTQRWDHCVVNLHLGRWRKEFGDDIDWSAYLANPHARPTPGTSHSTPPVDQAKLDAELAEFIGEESAAARFQHAKAKRTTLRKGKGGNQFAVNTRWKKSPVHGKAATSGPPRTAILRAGS